MTDHLEAVVRADEQARGQIASQLDLNPETIHIAKDSRGWTVTVKPLWVTGDGPTLSEAASDAVRQAKIITDPPPLHDWFLPWLKEHEESDLIYSKAASSQVMFVRDDLPRAWQGRNQAMAAQAAQGQRFSEGAPAAEDICIRVVGEHHSKSCRLPVYRMQITDTCRVQMRGNFHDWKLSVDSATPVAFPFPEDLWNPDDEYLLAPVYFEGFREGYDEEGRPHRPWVFKPYAKSDKKQFSLMLPYSNELVWAFFFLLWRAVR